MLVPGANSSEQVGFGAALKRVATHNDDVERDALTKALEIAHDVGWQLEQMREHALFRAMMGGDAWRRPVRRCPVSWLERRQSMTTTRGKPA
jgi:hypothetical protein